MKITLTLCYPSQKDRKEPGRIGAAVEGRGSPGHHEQEEAERRDRAETWGAYLPDRWTDRYDTVGRVDPIGGRCDDAADRFRDGGPRSPRSRV